ncbi:Myelin expression factor 2 [Varanus komodoensis]|nr:Myelin expression factor 2 [Varanus komodoensis]
MEGGDSYFFLIEWFRSIMLDLVIEVDDTEHADHPDEAENQPCLGTFFCLLPHRKKEAIQGFHHLVTIMRLSWLWYCKIFPPSLCAKEENCAHTLANRRKQEAKITNLEKLFHIFPYSAMFNGQFLFDRPMHVKMDDKSIPHDDFRVADSKTPQLPRGLGGIGMGLGPGGQPISATQLSMGGGMGSVAPGGMGVDGPGFGGINRMTGGEDLFQLTFLLCRIYEVSQKLFAYISGVGGFGGMKGMANMGGFGGVSRMGGMGSVDDFRGNIGSGMTGGIGTSMGAMATGMGEMFRGGMGGSIDRDFGRSDMAMNRGFGDSFGRMGGAMVGGFAGGMGASNMGPVGSGMSSGISGMNSMTGGMGMGIGMDRMSSSFDRMGPTMGTGLERNIDMDRGFVPGPMGSGVRDRVGSKGNQIFVRNLPFDLTWQKLKEKFSQCGHVMFAEIKMENGKSKGCGTVRFDSPESAEKACRIMNGIKISGREIDVRLDRIA